MRTEAGLMILPLGWRFPQQFATREICCDSQFVPPELPDHPNGHCCWNHIILVKRAGGPKLGQQIWRQNDQATVLPSPFKAGARTRTKTDKNHRIFLPPHMLGHMQHCSLQRCAEIEGRRLIDWIFFSDYFYLQGLFSPFAKRRHDVFFRKKQFWLKVSPAVLIHVIHN
jgi:hypothetical protein